MAEYLPIHTPGQAITLKASGSISAGKIVTVSGSGTVSTAGADATAWVGVAANDAGTNDYVTIYCGGTQSVLASGTVTAGEAVECAASGAVATAGTPTVATIVGIALTTATDAAVRVRFIR